MKYFRLVINLSALSVLVFLNSCEETEAPEVHDTTPPGISSLYPIHFNDGSFSIRWNQNDDIDFSTYNLYQSSNEDMVGSTIIHTTELKTDTSIQISGVVEDQLFYFQIEVVDQVGLTSYSPIVIGDSYKIIVFSSEVREVYDIWTVNVLGTNETNLTSTNMWEQIIYFDPTFSPSGTEIISSKVGTRSLVIMSIDGSILLETGMGGGDVGGYFSYTQDGSKIIYTSDQWQGDFIESKILILDRNNNTTDLIAHGSEPVLSTDETTIIYSYTPNPLYGGDHYTVIKSIGIDGSNYMALTQVDSFKYDRSPDISHDGTKIVFHSNRDNEDEIFIMNSDGSSLINISNSVGRDRSPQFFLTGDKILFNSDRDGDWDIYSMDYDGSNVVNLSLSSRDDTAPSITPEGDEILFFSDREMTGGNEIFLMNLDGSNIRQITNNGRENFSAHYQP